MIIDNNKSLLRKKDKEVALDKEVTKEAKSSVVTTVEELLQKQVCHEFHNERMYLAMAIWCDIEGYTETARFLSKQAIEKRNHGMDFINYMLKQAIKVSPPQAREVDGDFENLEVLLEKALDQRVETTDMLKRLHTEALKTSDLSLIITKKYLKEQIEEEQKFLSILNLYKLCEKSKINFEIELNRLIDEDKYLIGML